MNTLRLTSGAGAPRRWRRAAALAITGLVGLASTATTGAQDATVVDLEHYQVAFENEQVRVLRIHYGPHEKSVMHSHPAGVVVFLDDLAGRFTMPDGETMDQEVEAGTVAWVDAQSHGPENLGDSPFR